jgi:hypothetical protein
MIITYDDEEAGKKALKVKWKNIYMYVCIYRKQCESRTERQKIVM